MKTCIEKKSLGAKTIVFPAPVLIIGSYDKNGKPNMMAAAWGGICCSVPPCIAFSARKSRYTHECVSGQKAFTVNIPPEKYTREADYVGIYSGRDENKFASTGLTAVKSELVNAPYIKEFPLSLECKLLYVHELGLHTQFVGEIMDVKIDADCLTEDGKPDIEKLRPIIYTPGLSLYYGFGKVVGEGYKIGKK